MFPKVYLTSHSRISGSRWVIAPSWLSGSLRSFCTILLWIFTPFLNLSCFCYALAVSVVYCGHLCMKHFVGISNVLDAISSHSHSIVFLCFFKKSFLTILAILWNLIFSWVYHPFSSLPFVSFLFFSQLFVRPPHTIILLCCIFFPLEVVLVTTSFTIL